MYGRILLPLDGSLGTERAVDHALALADRFDAVLDVLYVVDAGAFPLDAHARSMLEAREEEGRLAVAETVERANAQGIGRVHGTVERGTPHRVILDAVDETDADLVVMGTHGRRALDRFLLGSVTERVVRLAPVPVFAIPMRAEQSASADA